MIGLAGLLSNLHDIRKLKADLDKAEKAALDQIRPLVDPEFDACPDAPIVCDGLVLTRVAGVSRSISANLLLERGVAPDVIAYSTKTTNYYQYRIKETCKDGRQGTT